MAEEDGLLALQGLHSDLLAFSENCLNDIERLVNELDGRIEEFRSLLDKKGKADASRRKLQEGKVEIEDVVYTLNDEFKQQVIEVSDELDLDELEAAKLLIQSQDEAAELDRSPTASAIIRFHKRRQFLLECLRLLISVAQENEGDHMGMLAIHEIKRKIISVRDSSVGNGPKYWQKCFQALQDVEAWLLKLADRQQRVSIIGHSLSDEALELLDFESVSLVQQHESLATVCTMIIKDSDNYVDISNFKTLLQRIRTIDKHDLILVHYLPIILASIARFGDADSAHCLPEQAVEINKLFLAEKEAEHWALRNFHSAAYVWWCAEYFSKYKLDSNESERMEYEESTRFNKALQDGAFHFMLSVAWDTRKPDWYDPAKAGLISFLLADAVKLAPETPKPAAHFQRLFMDQVQLFVDAFISNMPNTLRNLKNEEDKQRLELLARFQKNTTEYQYHLERFLVILALAYEDSPEGALMFWDEPDGNLYGFLQWAAKRQTTPRVAAFCEMLGSLAENEENADAAHRFLLEEGSPVAGKLRRTGSLSWNQIYAEIFFYAKTIRDRPALPTTLNEYGVPPGSAQEVVEPESAMMLECYLRLVTQLCRHSGQARAFVLEWQHENLTLRDILFQLASSQIDSRLRACAFKTLQALLTNKQREESDTMWTKLDQWIAGGVSHTGAQAARVPARPSQSWSEQVIFETIASSFEEANSFLGLLNQLIAPSQDELGLNDALPYPENLGSTYRMSGIDSYVDFAVGKAFGDRTALLTDQVQLRLLRLSALDFIAACLSTFNEDLVVVANRSSFPVDKAMHTSSLEAYVRLHPFARVMEWMFNDKVLTALFATAHQDINEVNAAAADSPYILGLVRAVEVMNLVMRLQPTYLDIVRPVVKRKSTARRPTIAHSAISSFEDALLNNLQVVVDLGLYCGTGHQELTLASLALLEKLSSSRKLVVSPSSGFGKFSDRSKLIGVYEQNDDAERVSRSLIAELRIDNRELEGRESAPGYIIKTSILSFLKNCLSALPDRPTLAHLLLGFICRVQELEIASDGLIAQGTSLMHAIVTLAVDYPEVGPVLANTPHDDGPELMHPNTGELSYFAWLSNIKEACTEILRILWTSPLSNALVMTELRSIDFIFALAMRQGIVNQTTLWDGFSIRDSPFLYRSSALALRNFLRQRSAFYDYMSRELRVAASEKMNGLKARLQDTLLGQTKFPGQEPLPNSTVFDLFDFMELDIPAQPQRPHWENFADIDFEVCRFEGKGSTSPYDIASAQEIMLLRRNEVMSAMTSAVVSIDDPISKRFDEEFESVLLYLNALNQHQELLVCHAETLRSWSQLVIVAVENCNFDASTRTSFALQALQLVLPKLEHALERYNVTALWTARTLLQQVQILMKHVGLESQSDRKTDFGNDRVFNVFRIALAGIFADIADSDLRELCYNICYQYLQVTLRSAKKGSIANRHMMRSVNLAGERLLDIACDDAYSGEGRSRIAALMFLNNLVLLCNVEESKYVLEGFSRLNFVGVLVDGIKGMPQDLRETEDVTATIAYYTAELSLLLRISQTRSGATALLNAGFFPAIRESGLFSTDPDIGLDVDNPAALKIFFDIVLAMLKVISSVLLTRGVGNEQMKNLVRDFLNENRSSIVTVFKRNAKIGWNVSAAKEETELSAVLSECVDMYSLLISATGWLEHEDSSISKGVKTRLTVFS
ncbi:uncharacterized protein PV09_08860 [Verruconis gallopava]|uniref:Nucleoporin n=1 Tax=Verruconis gallopava TaxID=253628 RepID=A0A0D2AKC0_9PEZI|nr:uncharacterized protein PV09_08860 [Verruconis gallopava]KIV99428.1 hypothetical protein PV09_08860 [Verruconis gallopava]